MGLVLGHFLNGHYGAAELLVQLGHLGQYAVFAFRNDTEIIGQHHRKRVVSHQVAASENGVAQAFHFVLAGKGKGVVVDQVPDGGEQVFLAGAGNLVLQLVTDIEVILDGPFTPTGHKPEFVHASLGRFLNPVLHQGFVNNGKDFLGHGLGSGEEAGAVAGDGEQAFLDHQYRPFLWFS